MSSHSSTDLAVIGIGCLFPRAEGLPAFWANIVNGVDTITEVPASHWRIADYHDPDPKAPDRVYTARGGFLDPVDFNTTQFGIAPNTLEATDTSQLLGLVAARQALDDAGYGEGGRALDRRRVSVILGVTGTLELVVPLGARLGHPLWRRALAEAGVPDDVAADVVQRISDSYVPWQENSFPGLLGNVVAGRIANRLDLGGTNCVVDAACASSLSAIHLAALELQTGKSDLVLTGGVDTFNDIFMYMCFSKTPALSPTGDARPFDADGDGTILGEGLGMVVLKRLADARRDGDRVYAVLRGVGSSSDGRGNSIYAPRAEGQVEALRAAYREANVTPDTIELLEGHGTGTKVGDAAEVSALTTVYGTTGRAGSWCALGSVKSQVGHTKAAAGAAGLIKAVASLYHKILPPTLKVRQPLAPLQPGRGPFYVNAGKRPWLSTTAHPRRAAVSAFGFGGSNFHVVLEEADSVKPAIDWDGDTQVVVLGGDTPDAVTHMLDTWSADMPWPDIRAQAAAFRRTWSATKEVRLAFVVHRGRTDLARLLSQARSCLARATPGSVIRGPEGVFVGYGVVPGKLAVLFPGQGAQYPDMLLDLACHFPAAHQVLAETERAYTGPSRLVDVLYPPSAFSDAERAAQAEALRATDVAQPALGAVSLGAWRVLESFGLHADAFVGHSYGELTALCAAGRLDVADFCTLSALRGRLMAERPTGRDAGAMLAVMAPVNVIRNTLKNANLDLVLANRNAPEQTVLSGATALIEQAEAVFTSRQIRTRRLDVAAAFHSHLVADAARPLRVALEKVVLRSGKPVFANTTASPYPDDIFAARDLLSEQLARPVQFVASIEALARDGVRAFLEVGPGGRLSSLVEAILPGQGADVLALDATSGRRPSWFDLGCVLAWLAARGNPVRLDLWDEGYQDPTTNARPGHIVPLVGANYVKPRPSRPAIVPVRAEAKPAPPPPSSPIVHETPTVISDGVPPQSQRATDNSPRPAVPAIDRPAPAGLTEALEVTRASLTALQRLQEQTAQLHRQFLEGQEASQRTVQALVEQQQRLLQMGLGLTPTAVQAPALSPAPLAPPAPAPVAPTPEPPHVSAPLTPKPAPAKPSPPVVPAPIPHSPSPTALVTDQRVRTILLEVVAEKTGYPAEMLDLDMALDSDLGIDSIKRVEILSALQERLPEAPPVKPEHLGTLQTLRHIVAFLCEATVSPTDVPQSTVNVDINRLPTAIVTDRSSDQDKARTVLLEVVAEKTGYPAEMLDLDMALDSDLGIDSIKRVEILSALQERLPDAPLVKPEHMGTLQTLRHIAVFLANGAISPAPPVAPAAKTPLAIPDVVDTPPANTDLARVEFATPLAAIERSVVKVRPLDASKPRPPLRLPSGAEVWVTSDDAALAARLGQRLTDLGLKPRLLPCAALSFEPSPPLLGGLILLAPESQCPTAYLRDALLGVRQAAPGLRAAARAGGALLVTVSRLDGAFGFQGLDPLRQPNDGGLAGLVKTAAREWPDVSCKALDLAPSWPTVDAASQALATELFLSGPVEVGLTPSTTWTLDLAPVPLPTTGSAPFQAGDVVIVSGGARGVTAAAAVALAQAYRPTLILLGRTPVDTPEPPSLACMTTEADLIRELNRLNSGMSPRQLADRAHEVLAQREVRATLARIQEAGARAVYQRVDIRDQYAMTALMDAIRRDFGPIRGLVHGAGILADARLEDKTADQFDRVFGTKVDGLHTLLAALDQKNLRVVVLFSSTTARLGRVGQADYAMANEVLNKTAQQLARRLPACRVLAINWGPWAGGMVTPALKKLFESEGIGLIPIDQGAEYLTRELASTEKDVEVIILGTAPPQARTSPTDAVPQASLNPQPNPAPAMGRILPLAFERVMDLANSPILESHVLDGRAVLPLALTLEWLAHGASVHNPGLHFHGVNDLRVLHGVMLDGSSSLTLTVGTGKASKRDGLFAVPTELRGARPGGKEMLFARAEVLLTSQLPQAPSCAPLPTLPSYPHSIDKVYRDLLFHGPDLQGLERVEGCGPDGIIATVRHAPIPSAWLVRPLRQRWLADPLILDSAFQMLILWSLERRRVGNLPSFIGRYCQYVRSFPTDGVRISAHVVRQTDMQAVSNLDIIDLSGRLLARLEGLECTLDDNLARAFRRNRLAGAKAL